MAAPIKYFHSGQSNGPGQLAGTTAGTLITLLDKCLVDGYAEANSITAVSVVSGVATVTSAGHGFNQYDVIEISGATGGDTEWNDEWRLTAVTTDTFTFNTDIADTSTLPAGTPVASTASLGFVKVFSDTNRAAYKSSAVGSSGVFLYVNDNASGTQTTATARVDMYHTMSDIDTGIGGTSETNGPWWRKTQTTAISRDWVLFGDSRFFHFIPRFASTEASYGGQWQVFGDYVSINDVDISIGMIAGDSQEYVTPYGGYNWMHTANAGTTTGAATTNGVWLSKSYTNIGAPVEAVLIPPPFASNGTGWGYGGLSYPTTFNKVQLVKPFIYECSTAFRGYVPGAYVTNCAIAGSPPIYDHQSVFTVDGKDYMVVYVSRDDTSSGHAVIFIDMTGPWR